MTFFNNSRAYREPGQSLVPGNKTGSYLMIMMRIFFAASSFGPTFVLVAALSLLFVQAPRCSYALTPDGKHSNKHPIKTKATKETQPSLHAKKDHMNKLMPPKFSELEILKTHHHRILSLVFPCLLEKSSEEIRRHDRALILFCFVFHQGKLFSPSNEAYRMLMVHWPVGMNLTLILAAGLGSNAIQKTGVSIHCK